MDIRKKIELVNTHGLLLVKLIFLSAPIWWSYTIVAFDIFLDIDLYVHLEPAFVTRYLIANGLLLIPLIWLFKKTELQKPAYEMGQENHSVSFRNKN